MTDAAPSESVATPAAAPVDSDVATATPVEAPVEAPVATLTSTSESTATAMVIDDKGKEHEKQDKKQDETMNVEQHNQEKEEDGNDSSDSGDIEAVIKNGIEKEKDDIGNGDNIGDGDGDDVDGDGDGDNDDENDDDDDDMNTQALSLLSSASVGNEITIDDDDDDDDDVIEITKQDKDTVETHTICNENRNTKEDTNVTEATEAATTTTTTTTTTATTSQSNPIHDFNCDEPDDPDDDELDDLDDDELDDLNEEDEEGDNEVTFISVYTGEEVQTPPPPSKTSCNGNNNSSSKSTKSSKKRSPMEQQPQFYALRKGKSTSSCLYLRSEELELQTKNYPEAEYKAFHLLEDALEYISSDPMYVVRSKKKRKVYEEKDDKKGDSKKAKTDNEDDESWEGMYLQLVKFHREHGNTDVPSLTRYRSLNAWTKNQRKEFNDLVNNAPSMITEAQVQLLVGLNFDFGIKPSSKSFCEYCQELVDFRARNDNTDPRSGTNLSYWIQRIKKKYERFLSGTVESVIGMDHQKVYDLELIGFSWTRKPSDKCKMSGRTYIPTPTKVVEPADAAYSTAAFAAASSNSKAAVAFASASVRKDETPTDPNYVVPYETNLTKILPMPPGGIPGKGNLPSRNSKSASATSKSSVSPTKTKTSANTNVAPMANGFPSTQNTNTGVTRMTPMAYPYYRPGMYSTTPMNPYMPAMMSAYYNNYNQSLSNKAGSNQPGSTQSVYNQPGSKQSCSTQPVSILPKPSTNGVTKPNSAQKPQKSSAGHFKNYHHPSEGIREIKWNKNFDALKEFKEKNGNLDVEKDSDLAKWCTIQRNNFKKFKRGAKTGMLTDDKVAKLMGIGFNFEPFDCMNKRWQKFHSKFEEMKKFKEEHGHLEVPTKGHLYSWTTEQKNIYRKYEEEKKKEGFVPNPWTEEKLAKLQDIGFDFFSRRKSDQRVAVNKKSPPPMSDEQKAEQQEKWSEMYDQMKAFKEKNGHCIPPSKPTSGLRTWMERQRSEYKKYIVGNHSSMTSLRIRYLNELQFPFNPTRVKIPWEERFEELKQFKAKYGNCLVPRGYTGKLGTWLQNQRSKYKILKAGGKSTMTEERVKKLEDLGMVWSILPTPVVTERKTWDERFEDLLEYKEEHGHMRVPQSWPGLGNWVHSQRVGYQLMKKGRDSRLTTEKALKLAEAGFEFVVAPRKQRASRQNLYDPHPHLARRAAEEALEKSDSSEEEEEGEEEEEEQDTVEARVQWLTGTGFM